ncbi:High-affinity nitrate transporter 3.1 [Bienertia sinuspersici]
MAIRGVIIFVALLSSFIVTCYGAGSFAELAHTLSVSASPTGKVYLTAGEDEITVTWGLNSTTTDTTAYKKIEVELCYLAESQKDRPWRRTEDDLDRDKTCQFLVAAKDFKSSSKDSATYTVKKDVPSAHFFIRAYVLDPKGKKIAYGQTNGLDIKVKGISGRSASIDIAASIFSAFSVLSLVFFYFNEKRIAKQTA